MVDAAAVRGGEANARNSAARARRCSLGLFALMVALGACGSVPPGSSPPATPAGTPPGGLGNTIVTLAFDDGSAGQWAARDILAANQQHATFFIISGDVGLHYYLNLEQLRQLQQDGHEIGGHTVTHPVSLISLGPSRQRHEICDCRQALLQMGLSVDSFAYPRDSEDPAVEAIVRECGYTAGRAASGIRSPTCPKCALAETIPPRDPFAIRTVSSVESTVTIGELEQVVIDAKNGPGGWVIFVFHRLCDPICWHNAVTPTTFAAFSKWLADEGIPVRTIHEVMTMKDQPAQGPL